MVARQNDETLWLYLTQSTFRLSPHSLAPPAPQSGWSKRVYAGLLHPRTYVWGSADNGRLGLPRPSPGNVRILIHLRFVHSPRDITEQFESGQRGRTWGVALRDSLAAAAGRDGQGDERRGGGAGAGGDGGVGREGMGAGDAAGKEIGVVELQAGGWSFTARDMDGGIWVWGESGCIQMLQHTSSRLSEVVRTARAWWLDRRVCWLTKPRSARRVDDRLPFKLVGG
jgi:SCF-associated factor 1